MNSTNIRSFFSQEEIGKIANVDEKDRRHPLKRLLFPADRDLQVATNTETALRQIRQHGDDKWIDSIKPRLLSIKDFSDASSALGEIRAYGNLLESGITTKPVRPGNNAQPDFRISHGADSAQIEVHSKQLYEEESSALEKFNKQRFDKTEKTIQRVIVREHVITPFGKPGVNESVTGNAIRKIAQIKQQGGGLEPQMHASKTSLLWLDFQDEIWDSVIKVESALPIRSWNGAFYSGEFWYAFYGWERAPIFEGQTTADAPSKPPMTMLRDGRFRQKTNVDAVIVSFPQATLVFENPFSKKPIKPWLWKKITCLPWFNVQFSQANWPSGDLAERVEMTRKMLRNLLGTDGKYLLR